MTTIRENKINDMIFAMGMYGAMSKGTINMMRNLAKQSGANVPPKNENKEKKEPVESLDSTNTVIPEPIVTDTTTTN